MQKNENMTESTQTWFTLKYVPKMDSFINYNHNHNKMIDQFVTIMSIISAIRVMFFGISSES